MQTGGAAAETGHGKTDDPDLPKALIKKIVKAKLASLDAEKKVGSSNKPVGEVQVSKDAVLACSESAKVLLGGNCAAPLYNPRYSSMKQLIRML